MNVCTASGQSHALMPQLRLDCHKICTDVGTLPARFPNLFEGGNKGGTLLGSHFTHSGCSFEDKCFGVKMTQVCLTAYKKNRTHAKKMEMDRRSYSS